MRARLALSMPAFVYRADGRILGIAMGYTTERPKWPAEFEEEWKVFETRVPGASERFEEYEAQSKQHSPQAPHHYLGVLGVLPEAQGTGVGHALLEHVCETSRKDPQSEGVYLETGSPDSLAFYLKRKFELVGEGKLGPATLWCVYRPTRGPA